MIVLSEREQRLLLDVPREKLTRLLRYFGSFFVFPVLVGIKTFLLIELGMAVLSPLLSAVIASGERKSHRH